MIDDLRQIFQRGTVAGFTIALFGITVCFVVMLAAVSTVAGWNPPASVTEGMNDLLKTMLGAVLVAIRLPERTQAPPEAPGTNSLTTGQESS